MTRASAKPSMLEPTPPLRCDTPCNCILRIAIPEPSSVWLSMCVRNYGAATANNLEEARQDAQMTQGFKSTRGTGA